MWRAQALFLAWSAGSAIAHAEKAADRAGAGKALLQGNCARCHAVAAGTDSPLQRAPNLAIVLQSYPRDRLEHELSEGIAPKHPDMPQVRFTASEIDDIYTYLHGRSPAQEERLPQ